jgi:hypothetical protein
LALVEKSFWPLKVALEFRGLAIHPPASNNPIDIVSEARSIAAREMEGLERKIGEVPSQLSVSCLYGDVVKSIRHTSKVK